MAGGVREIAGFRVLSEVGSGGIGVVYLAEGQGGARVALKVLHPGTSFREADVRRLVREARVQHRLAHPHILPVLAIRMWRTQPVLVMDYVEGAPLSRWRAEPAEREATLGERVLVLASIADALQHAHDHDVVHRDVKPANILVRDDGHPFLIDFGMARTLGVDSTITASGTLLGTPGYLAPEVLSGTTSPDFRADVYSLGVTLFETVTGRLPFDGETLPQLFERIQQAEPPPLRSLAPHAPPSLETIVARALEKRPRDRYASAAALRDDLRRAARGLRPRTGRVSLWVNRELRSLRRARMRIAAATVAGLVALLALAAFAFDRLRDDLRAREVAELLAEGDRRLERGELQLALDEYARAEQVAPGDWRPAIGRAKAFAEFEMVAPARAALDVARARGYDFGGDVPDARDAYLRALVGIGDWELERALADLGLALSLDPQYYRAALLLESLQRRAGRQDEARRTLETCRRNLKEVDPRHALITATIAQLDGRHDEAVAVLDRLADSADCPGWIHSSLGFAYLEAYREGGRRAEHLARGVAQCTKAVEFEPRDAYSWANLAVAALDSGERDAARAHAERASSIDAGQDGANRILAVLAADRSDWETAERHLSAIRSIEGAQAEVERFRAEVDFERGRQEYLAQRPIEAAAALRRCVERNPAHLAAWFLLGNSLWLSEDGEASLAAFERALALWDQPPPAGIQERWLAEVVATKQHHELDLRVGILSALALIERELTAEERAMGVAARAFLRQSVRPGSLNDVATVNLAKALTCDAAPELRDCDWAHELLDAADLSRLADDAEAIEALDRIEASCR